MIYFKPIQLEDFEKVRWMDALCFGRKDPRSDEDLANKRAADPDGCLLMLVDEKPVGYVFSHRFGKIGYLGPLGIHPNEQGKGYAKPLVTAGINFLQQTCDIIGLETMPERGKNLQLYHSLGFRAFLPVRLMKKELQAASGAMKLPQDLIKGSELNNGQLERVIQDISQWNERLYPGLDLTKDIVRFLKQYPERILFAVKNGKTSGFLAVHPEFHRFVWGAVEPGPEADGIFVDLLRGMDVLQLASSLMIRFQTHFSGMTDLLLQNGYRINDDKTFMLLKGYEGEFGKPRDQILARSWVD